MNVWNTPRLGKAELGRNCRPIVMACDEAYAMPLATALRSMTDANQGGTPLDVIILGSRFSHAQRNRVMRSLPDGAACIRWVFTSLNAFDGFGTRPYISRITYARLMLCDLFDDTVRTALYLDADVLVLSDLAPLWSTDLDGSAIAAVIDTDSEAHSVRIWRSTETGGAGSVVTKTRPPYFNAGVLLVDLERWREERIGEKALRYMHHDPGTLLGDQDALNVACGGHWKPLEPRWNCQQHHPDGYASMPIAKRPSIVHFAGQWKPWNPLSLSRDADFYDECRNRTQFARTKLERAGDALKRAWMRWREFLKRYRMIATIYSWVHGRGTSPFGSAEANETARGSLPI